ncbi:hypothetical protein Tco_0570396 [Tanacetum coccineum]
MKLREGLFSVDIRRPSSGVKLFEGAVSRDAYFISGLAMRRAANVVDLMSLHPQLHDPHSELLLLRSCMGIAKLFFDLKTCQPAHMEEATLFFDKGLGRHVWIPFGNMRFIIKSSQDSSIDTIWFGTSFLTYIGVSRSSSKKEAPVKFLTDPSDGRSILRPADVLVFGWVGGKHACVDLIGVSPLVRLSSQGFTTGQSALKATSCKVTKHKKTCIKNQYVFIPFVFDTFGFLAPVAVELLSRGQQAGLPRLKLPFTLVSPVVGSTEVQMEVSKVIGRNAR